MTARPKPPSGQEGFFWKTKTLEEMSSVEWESLCDGCARSCLEKLEDEDTGRIYFTHVSCRLQAGIQKPAGNMGEIDPPGILILQLFQAAARAAVAQALPFVAGHFLQRLGFPEKSLLVRGSLGCCCHDCRGLG